VDEPKKAWLSVPRKGYFMPAKMDISNQRFGKWVALRRTYKSMWLCRCDCGNEKEVSIANLRGGLSKQCRSCADKRQPYNFIDLTGKRFGKLVVISRVKNGPYGRGSWLCKCDCGNEKICKSAHLLKGDTKSCGCLTSRKEFGLGSAHAVLRTYQNNAKKRNLSWDLSEPQFLQITQEKCFYCGAEKSNRRKAGRGYGDYLYNGIDRYDNRLGYTVDNVVPCCDICNSMKSNFSADVFIEHIKKIQLHAPHTRREAAVGGSR